MVAEDGDWWLVTWDSRGLSWSIRGAVVHVTVDVWGAANGCSSHVRGGEYGVALGEAVGVGRDGGPRWTDLWVRTEHRGNVSQHFILQSFKHTEKSEEQ